MLQSITVEQVVRSTMMIVDDKLHSLMNHTPMPCISSWGIRSSWFDCRKLNAVGYCDRHSKQGIDVIAMYLHLRCSEPKDKHDCAMFFERHDGLISCEVDTVKNETIQWANANPNMLMYFLSFACHMTEAGWIVTQHPIHKFDNTTRYIREVKSAD